MVSVISVSIILSKDSPFSVFHIPELFYLSEAFFASQGRFVGLKLALGTVFAAKISQAAVYFKLEIKKKVVLTNYYCRGRGAITRSGAFERSALHCAKSLLISAKAQWSQLANEAFEVSIRTLLCFESLKDRFTNKPVCQKT